MRRPRALGSSSLSAFTRRLRSWRTTSSKGRSCPWRSALERAFSSVESSATTRCPPEEGERSSRRPLPPGPRSRPRPPASLSRGPRPAPCGNWLFTGAALVSNLQKGGCT